MVTLVLTRYEGATMFMPELEEVQWSWNPATPRCHPPTKPRNTQKRRSSDWRIAGSLSGSNHFTGLLLEAWEAGGYYSFTYFCPLWHLGTRLVDLLGHTLIHAGGQRGLYHAGLVPSQQPWVPSQPETQLSLISRDWSKDRLLYHHGGALLRHQW